MNELLPPALDITSSKHLVIRTKCLCEQRGDLLFQSGKHESIARVHNNLKFISSIRKELTKQLPENPHVAYYPTVEFFNTIECHPFQLFSVIEETVDIKGEFLRRHVPLNTTRAKTIQSKHEIKIVVPGRKNRNNIHLINLGDRPNPLLHLVFPTLVVVPRCLADNETSYAKRTTHCCQLSNEPVQCGDRNRTRLQAPLISRLFNAPIGRMCGPARTNSANRSSDGTDCLNRAVKQVFVNPAHSLPPEHEWMEIITGNLIRRPLPQSGVSSCEFRRHRDH